VPDKGSEDAYRAKVALHEVIHQAKLYLNETEGPSGKLLTMMQDLPDKYTNNSHTARTYQTEKPIISSLMQEILKQEWNRVRDGEILWSINNFFLFIGLPSWFNLSRIRLFWLIVFSIAAWAVLKLSIYNLIGQAQ